MADTQTQTATETQQQTELAARMTLVLKAVRHAGTTPAPYTVWMFCPATVCLRPELCKQDCTCFIAEEVWVVLSNCSNLPTGKQVYSELINAGVTAKLFDNGYGAFLKL
jgi:hypothetical protein